MKNVNRRERFPKNGGKNQMIFGGYFKNMPLSLEIQNSDCVQRGSSVLSTEWPKSNSTPGVYKQLCPKKKNQNSKRISCKLVLFSISVCLN